MSDLNNTDSQSFHQTGKIERTYSTKLSTIFNSLNVYLQKAKTHTLTYVVSSHSVKPQTRHWDRQDSWAGSTDILTFYVRTSSEELDLAVVVSATNVHYEDCLVYCRSELVHFLYLSHQEFWVMQCCDVTCGKRNMLWHFTSECLWVDLYVVSIIQFFPGKLSFFLKSFTHWRQEQPWQ